MSNCKRFNAKSVNCEYRLEKTHHPITNFELKAYHTYYRTKQLNKVDLSRKCDILGMTKEYFY